MLCHGNTDESSAVVTVISSPGSFDLSGEVPASLPSVPAIGVAHLDLSDRFLGVPDNSFTLLSAGFDGTYGNPLFFYF